MNIQKKARDLTQAFFVTERIIFEVKTRLFCIYETQGKCFNFNISKLFYPGLGFRIYKSI
jgi:hypothetical protein